MAYSNKVFKNNGLMPLSSHNVNRTSLAGFTLLEVLLAAVILVVGVLGAMKIFIPMFRSIEADRERVAMTNIALDRIEEWRSYTYSELVPDMQFTYFTRAIDPNTGVIAFGQKTTTIDSVSKINLTPDTQTCAPGYNYTHNLPSNPTNSGTDVVNDVWYDGPEIGENTPGEIIFTLTCPKGVSGILTIIVWDYDNRQREEKVYVNGIVEGVFNNVDSNPNNNFTTPREVEVTLSQSDTQTGQITIEIRQTADGDVSTGTPNPPTFGGSNPNAVVSSIDFSILEGFPEHDSAFPYVVESKITSTYDVARLVPGWEITVTVSRSDREGQYMPVSLTTTISK